MINSFNKPTRLMASVLTVLIMTFALNAQNNIRLISGQGVFKVSLGRDPVNRIAQAEVLIEGILKDTLSLTIEAEGKSKSVSTLYLLLKGVPVKHKEFNYLVDLSQIKPELVFKGIDDIIKTPEPIVPIKPVVDTSMKYQNMRLGHLCELKTGKPLYYNNVPRKGQCVEAMPDSYLSYVQLLMNKAQVPDEKFLIAENVCRNNCISTTQLAALLNYIEFELEKLKLIKLGFQHLVDKQNKKTLEKSFRFESSINELNIFFKEASLESSTGKECVAPSTPELINKFIESLSVFSNDSQRYDYFKKSYGEYCFPVEYVKLTLRQFIHDREKLDAAKLLYNRCTEKNRFQEVGETFSYNQSISELTDYISKQQ